jgi:predicted nuclease of predicted toxin-antitoxin system
MRSADDSEILQWAAAANRIVITQDRATMIGQALNRVAAGQSVPGLFILRPRTPNQGAIEAILLAEECSNQEEWRNRVEFLPL